MKVLIACEESQRVCIEFRKRGHEAYSCDVIECSGGHPEWHIQSDVIPLLNGECDFTTLDGKDHKIHGEWDLIIAHPPCTFLTTAGNAYFNVEKYGQKAIERRVKRTEAIEFFMRFVTCNCQKICIENPQGVISTVYRRPDQTIHPYYFATAENDIENYHLKRTCLWLKGLKPLERPTHLKKPEALYCTFTKNKKVYFTEGIRTKGTRETRAKLRSKTFPAIAKAMADQWG